MSRTFDAGEVKQILDGVLDMYLARRTSEFYLYASGVGRTEEKDLPVLSGKCSACNELKSQLYTEFGLEKDYR